ncbi:MAG TPA: helix-turn-helix transcriptional regulator [Candidatus Limnocylindria bacterium]|jgi:DNA-binding CsgD family transcriptional regulator|nr:helix-turn-helix transcriptional regulator [Candidatus Limnocylindria bacterium]
MPIARPLTPRQHLILRHVARGATNKEIARELGISEQGVKVHISRLLERYGAENRVQLVNITRAWSSIDLAGYSSLSDEVAGIRQGLSRGFPEVTSGGEIRVSRAEVPGATFGGNGGLSPQAPLDLVQSVKSLRELLNEVHVAVKLARELPPESASGPLVDAIRTRVRAALAESDKLATLIARERDLQIEREESHTAS